MTSGKRHIRGNPVGEAHCVKLQCFMLNFHIGVENPNRGQAKEQVRPRLHTPARRVTETVETNMKRGSVDEKRGTGNGGVVHDNDMGM